MHMERSAKEYARKIIIIRCDEHLCSEIQKKLRCKFQDMKRKSKVCKSRLTNENKLQYRTSLLKNA